MIVAACLVAADVAGAADSSKAVALEAMMFEMPFVSVSLPEAPVYVGEVYGPGTKRLNAKLVAHVTANCPYHVDASFQGFRHERSGGAISPKHLSVAINGKAVRVGTGRVPHR